MLWGNDCRAAADASGRPASTPPWLPERSCPVYYIDDGWISSLSPPLAGKRRLCWVPADWGTIQGRFLHVLALGEEDEEKRTLDFTALQSYLDDLHRTVL